MAGRNMTEAPVSSGDNSKMIKMALSVFEAPEIDLNDSQAVQQRIVDYFCRCDELQLRPGNMGLYSALGLSRQEVHNIISGRDKKKVSPATCDTIKKALRILSAYREMLGSTGKINPVTLIFWQKNFDGLQDQHQIEIERSDLAGAAAHLTPEEIAKRISEDIPLDVDTEGM